MENWGAQLPLPGVLMPGLNLFNFIRPSRPRLGIQSNRQLSPCLYNPPSQPIPSSEDLVQDKTERWFQLCQQAAVEQDPDKLLTLIQEINNLLEDKERRLQRERADDEAGLRP